MFTGSITMEPGVDPACDGRKHQNEAFKRDGKSFRYGRPNCATQAPAEKLSGLELTDGFGEAQSCELETGRDVPGRSGRRISIICGTSQKRVL